MKVDSLNKLAWQKLKQNKLASFSLAFIITSVFVAFFAVPISSDKTPMANEMHIELATLKPLTKVIFLESSKAQLIEVSFL